MSTNLSLAPKELPWEELRVQSGDWEPLKVGQKPSFISHVTAQVGKFLERFLLYLRNGGSHLKVKEIQSVQLFSAVGFQD